MHACVYTNSKRMRTRTYVHIYTYALTHVDTYRHLRAGGLKKKVLKRERFSGKT